MDASLSLLSPDNNCPFYSTNGIFVVSKQSQLTGELQSNVPFAPVFSGTSSSNNLLNLSSLIYLYNDNVAGSLSPGGYSLYFIFIAANGSAISLSIISPLVATVV